MVLYFKDKRSGCLISESAPLCVCRFRKRESAEPHLRSFPHAQRLYRSDDFVNDEMPAHGSIDFVALNGQRNGDGRCTKTQQPSDSSPWWVGQSSRHRGRWADWNRFRHQYDLYPRRDQGGQNGGYSDYTESHYGPPHNQQAHHRRPGSRGSTARNGPDFLNRSGESGPVGDVQRTLSPPCKKLGAQLDAQPDAISRKKAKAKLRKQRKRVEAAKAAQALRTGAAVDSVADPPAERVHQTLYSLRPVLNKLKGFKVKESDLGGVALP